MSTLCYFVLSLSLTLHMSYTVVQAFLIEPIFQNYYVNTKENFPSTPYQKEGMSSVSDMLMIIPVYDIK